jgi:hypothetical protein
MSLPACDDGTPGGTREKLLAANKGFMALSPEEEVCLRCDG